MLWEEERGTIVGCGGKDKLCLRCTVFKGLVVSLNADKEGFLPSI